MAKEGASEPTEAVLGSSSNTRRSDFSVTGSIGGRHST